MTHHEKDFGDYLEEVIIKVDGAIEQQYAKIRESSPFSELYYQHEAHIVGLREAKNILLGKQTWHKE